MPSRHEGRTGLLVRDGGTILLSALAVAGTISINHQLAGADTLPKRTNETHQIPPKPKTAKTIGQLAVYHNFYTEWQHHAAYITAVQPITDANSVNTADWRCIRDAEGSNPAGNYSQTSGAYGIVGDSNSKTWSILPKEGFSQAANYPTPGSAPPFIQDEAALFLFAQNHYHFSGTWNDYCTYSGIVH